MKVLPEKIHLANQGMEVLLSVSPTPIRGADGKYPLILGPSSIELIFLKSTGNPDVLDVRNWDEVITEATEVSLASGEVLSHEDLCEIDEQGWNILFDYGFWPSELILSDPASGRKK